MSCSTDHRATLYNLKTQKPSHTFTAHQDLITSTKFVFSQKCVLTSSLDTTIKEWDINTCNINRVIKTYSSCLDAHVSRTETYYTSGHKDLAIRVWNSKTKECVFKLEECHGDPVSCVRMTPNENYIVSTSKDDTIKIWDVRKRALLQTFEHEHFRLGSSNTKFCVSPNS